MKSSLLNIRSSEEILQGLKSRDRHVIKYIYRGNYSSIQKMVQRNSGKDIDAKDIFQDAMLIIYNKVIQDNLQLSSSFDTYLYAVCKNLWFQRLKKRKRMNTCQGPSYIENYPAPVSTEDVDNRSEMFQILYRNFYKLDKKSQQVLNLYINGTPHKETAELLGYSSEKYVKTKKFISKERLRNLVLGDPGYQQLMLEMAG